MDVCSDNSTEHTMFFIDFSLIQYNGTHGTYYHFHMNYIIMFFRCVHVTKLFFYITVILNVYFYNNILARKSYLKNIPCIKLQNIIQDSC